MPAYSDPKSIAFAYRRLSCLCAVSLIALAGLLPVSTAVAAPLRLEAPGAVRPLILKYVSAFDARDAAADSADPDLGAEGDIQTDEGDTLARIRRARKDIPELLETEGYFSSQIDVEQAPGSPALVRVQPGPRAVVQEVVLRFEGDLNGERPDLRARRESLLAAWTLGKGGAFSQAGWSAAKAKLLADVSSQDYAAARIVDSTADIDPERAVARLLVVIDSGPAFRIGPIDVVGLSLYSRDLVERYSSVTEGERYDYERLVTLQNSLQSTPYFSGAIVEIDRDPALADASPLRVSITEAKPRRFGVGVGFSSNTGARGEVNYRDANLFSNAWELNSTVRLEEKRQSAFADVFLPQTHSGFRDAVGLSGLAENIQNLATSRFSVGVQRARTLQRTTTRISINYQHETTEPEGGVEQISTALTLNCEAGYRVTDNPADPQRGYGVSFQIGGGSKHFFSDQSFLRVYGRGQYFRPLGESGTFILRGEAGYTVAPSSEGIPQDFLFRTGGSQSVRGYDYQSLGVQDGVAIVGGRTLAVASLEYVRWVSGPWGLATFVDAGDANDTWQDMRWRVGYGLGGRWRSPAGPLGVDVAYGQSDEKFRLHFTLALAF
ncbi:autotransporter assembly complex protein TamA [Niveibacterium sp. 24ML]|uniref:autotransporter assembly complex protein TamA n=1 Tax=Niveibacterium sp. 24ML TaxID=2985512 RepID=UPI0022710859|nr:autotransporter assembly complex family protein [Niveibacterium sp. 24ML]MCX9156830.1 autotransporter assembly complex protein TamA [Niveibacterium sp. 24ML]